MDARKVSSSQSDPRAGSGEMFDQIADRYDLLNRLMSLGIDQSWRRKTVESLELPDGARVLDLATGTADLALLIAAMAPTAHITGVDPSENMLSVGRQKVASAALSSRIELSSGIAEEIPAEDDTFDGLTIAFGIRNVPDRPGALAEMARVTRPSGRVAILELSEPREGLFGPFARFHIRTVVPWLGGLISGSREYRYLQQSIGAFPPPSEFAASMTAAGLDVISIEPLTFGVCHLYVARPRGTA